MRTAIEEFNEKVEYVRSLMSRMGLRFESDKLEYEVARAVARRLKDLVYVDLRQLLNEIYDSLDSTLTVGENVKIAESIIEKWAGKEYDVESMYEAYESWIASERRLGGPARSELSVPAELLLGVDTGAGRRRGGKRGKRERAERPEANLESRLADIAARVEELSGSLRGLEANLRSLEANLTHRLNELSSGVEELRRGARESGDEEFREEVKAAFGLVMSTLKRLEARVEKLEREVERPEVVVTRGRERRSERELERYYARRLREKWWLL